MFYRYFCNIVPLVVLLNEKDNCKYNVSCSVQMIIVIVIQLSVLLIVKDNVRSPDVVAGNVKLGHSAIFVRVPFQLVVPPKLKYYSSLSSFII